MRLRQRESGLIKAAGSALIVPALNRDAADEGLAVVTGPAGEEDQAHVFAGLRYFAMTFRHAAGWALCQPGLHREWAAA